jgi:cyclase
MPLRPRIIPCLLLHKSGLAKTERFANPRYVGDPLNAVRIFNEKRADELMVLDIDATVEGREPRYDLISALARECRMPLCYGGGVTDADQVDRIVSLGVEKVTIGAAFATDPRLVEESAGRVGSQSVAVVIDTLRDASRGIVRAFTRRATQSVAEDPVMLARRAAQAGAGEIVLNSIDRDGTMAGYDVETIASVRASVRVPVTAIGGASSFNEMMRLCRGFPGVAAAAGSLFVFKGRYRAVLIQYPTRDERALAARG